jgi:hypothetical protein
VFGNVIFCTGQSNQWLPISYTFERHKTFAALAKGDYSNLRLFNYGFARSTDPPPSQDPMWVSPSSSEHSWVLPTNDTVNRFGSTCWYFGQVGGVHTLVGGVLV